MRPLRPIEVPAGHLTGSSQRFACRLAEQRHALLAALAQDAQLAAGQVEVGELVQRQAR